MCCGPFVRNVDDVSPPLSSVNVTLSKLVVVDFIHQAYHFIRQQHVSNEYVTSLFFFKCVRLCGKVDKNCELMAVGGAGCTSRLTTV